MALGLPLRRRASRCSSIRQGRQSPRRHRRTAPLSPSPAQQLPCDSARRSIPARGRHRGLIVQSAIRRDHAGQPTSTTHRPGPGRSLRPADLAPGYVYLVTVGDVRDLAGNRAVGGSWTIKRVLPAVCDRGGDSQRGGCRLVRPAGRGRRHPAGRVAGARCPGGWRDRVRAGSLGRAEWRPVRPHHDADTEHLVSSELCGHRDHAGPSASVQVLVRRKVALLGPGSSVTRTAVAGRSVTLTAQVGPAGVAPVSFQLYRYDAARRNYVLSRSFGRTTDLLGRARLTWTPAAGRFAWRLVASPTADYANNATPLYRWSVSP